MLKTLLAAAAAFTLVAATPALAGCDDCKNCPHHKVAAADKEKKVEVSCHCGDGKTCKCGDQCQCAHCTAKREKKEEKKT